MRSDPSYLRSNSNTKKKKANALVLPLSGGLPAALEDATQTANSHLDPERHTRSQCLKARVKRSKTKNKLKRGKIKGGGRNKRVGRKRTQLQQAAPPVCLSLLPAVCNPHGHQLGLFRAARKQPRVNKSTPSQLPQSRGGASAGLRLPRGALPSLSPAKTPERSKERNRDGQ